MAETSDALEQVEYVNDVLYEQLMRVKDDPRAKVEANDSALRMQVEPFLYREARFLDDRHYEEWLNLFDPECIYWVPAAPEPRDPRTETSIHLDDHRRLADRIALIRTGYLHAQTPPSRTRRTLTNVEAWQGNDKMLLVRSNVVIWEFRKEKMNTYVGWQEHLLHLSDAGEFKIKYKIINLLNCDSALGNITFIL